MSQMQSQVQLKTVFAALVHTIMLITQYDSRSADQPDSHQIRRQISDFFIFSIAFLGISWYTIHTR